MPRPFAVIGFTVFFTIAMLYKFKTGVTIAALAVFTVALVLALLIKNIRQNRVVPCSLASAVFACVLLLSSVIFSYTPAVSYNGKTCDISAVLISEPEYEYGNCYYLARASQIDNENVDLKLRLTFSSVPDAEPYDEIHGKFTFYIPGASNEVSLLTNKSNGIFIAAYPSDDEYKIFSVPESDKPFGYRIINIRNEIRNAVYRILPNENGALAVALLIGDKSGLPSDILNDFSFIGISHIICVSGYHLSLWSMLIYEVLRKTRIGERITSIVCIFAVILIMLISGMTYSVVRSGIMMIIYLVSNVLLRKRDSLNSLGFALMLIAVFNPFAMGSASLQLSALATAGIIFYSDSFAAKIDSLTDKINFKALKRIVKSVMSTCMITLAATAFTLPVSLSLYNRFNFAVFIANIFAVPLSGICMILSIVGALVGCFTTSILNIPAYFGGLISEFLIWFSDKFAQFNLLSFNIENDETAIIILGIFLIISLAFLFSYFGKSYPGLTCVICSVVFLFTLYTFSVNDRKMTKLCVVDCGNGTSVIMTKNNESILIGCGGTEFLGLFNICNVVEETGNNLNAIIMPDSDENVSAYFNGIIREFNPSEIFSNSLPPGSSFLLNDTDVIGFETEKKFDNFNVLCDNIDGKYVSFVENEDVSVLILFDPITNISLLPEKYQKADIVITRNDYPSGIESANCVLTVINADNSRGIILQDELKNMGVNCAATASCGNIIIKADNGYISSYRDD